MSLLYLVLSATFVLLSLNNNFYSFAETDIDAVKDNATENSLYSETELAQPNDTTNSSNSRHPRTFHGLLGFLTGFRLAQGMGPTSYNADIRDSPQLNLLSKLFDGALYLSYIRYPQMPSYPTFYQPLPTHPQNLFPTGLQLPLWFPPEFISQNGVNLSQQFNPDTGLPTRSTGNKRNNQVDNTTDQITTNIAEEILPTTSVTNEIIEVSTVINELKIKNSPDISCNNTNMCTEVVTLDERTTVMALDERTTVVPQDETLSTTKMIDSNNFTKPKLKDIFHSLSLRSENTENQMENEGMKEEDKNATMVNVTMATTSNNTQNITTEDSLTPSDTNITIQAVNPNTTIQDTHPNTTIEHPSFYPYPYYHNYENSSDYEHVSITESPVSHDHFLKQHDYYDDPATFDNYLPHTGNEQTIPFDTSAEESQFFTQQSNFFHPMNNPYYNSENLYANHQQETFNERVDTGFVPLQTFNRV